MDVGKPSKPLCAFAACFGLAGLFCVAFLSGCREAATPTLWAAAATGQDAEVGATLTHDQWSVTLIEAPYSADLLGVGTVQMHYQAPELGAAEADGIFVVVPVALVNGADEIRMFSRGAGLVVTDAQGREMAMATSKPHFALVYADVERWGTQDNQLIQNPMEAGVRLEGPLVFDVPEDATGLTLHFQGSDELIDLGL